MAPRARQRIALILACWLGCGAGIAFARADIVFLLQQEGHGDPRYFELAAVHYRQQSGVVLVVDRARSLLQVREFLQRSPLRGAQPWGRIVLVAHGSRWTGLSVPIFDDLGIPAPGDWRRVRARGEFIPLTAPVVDSRTRLQIDSCGLGARSDLLRELVLLLAGEQRPVVEASTGLVEFRSDPDALGDAVIRIERPYVATVRPRYTAGSGATRDAHGRRRLPIEFRQQLAPDHECSRAILPGLIRGATPMARTLRDHGLRAEQLHFDLVDEAGDCQLRGRAVLIVEAESAHWPLQPVRAAVQ